MKLDVVRDGAVTVATWSDGENRLNVDSVGALAALAEELEQTQGPAALVVAGEGNFFSNGLDLERYASDPDGLARTVDQFHGLLARLYVLPVYTVAVVNGHAFAGGAMLTCAFDHRVMREDRGYWCLNEAEIGLPLTPQMTAAVLGRLPRASGLEAMLTARRYTGPEAVTAGIVEETTALDRLIEVAVERASVVAGKHRSVVARHKRLAFADVARACSAPS